MSYPDPREATGATELIDADDPAVQETAARVSGTSEGNDAAARLFAFVRDEIAYEMAPDLSLGRDAWKATVTLERGYGFCQQKAVLLAALLRARGIPAGIVLQDIHDHKIPLHYVEFIGSQTLEMHGLTCAFLDGRWLRLDATLPRGLCAKKGYRLVEFDGSADAVLLETDEAGEPHFDVLAELGTWPDMPESIIERTLSFEWLQSREYREMAGRHGPGM